MSHPPPDHDRQAAPNRLAATSSPYLLQHQYNPVDWFPWGEEAFAEARRRNVPIFLSVGYSTCYWCHVMERESFESKVIARQMNESFVNIKLDREERPDVDEVYMAATQMLTGHGGWPMSVFLEPQTLKPFWAGTYFPPLPARGMPSFPQILSRMSDAWRDQRDKIIAQAETVAAAVTERLGARRPPTPALLGGEQVGMAVQTLLAIFDRVHGGFGHAPKFPQPVYLELLLAVRPRLTDPQHAAAVDAALRRTLDAMAMGGIFDHVGGGFHRYAVDASWTVPHFEKMLYDNAQLLSVYAQAAAEFNDHFYAHTAARIVEYIRREMTAPSGMFYTAQDAEVDGREGLSYVWTPEQFAQVLSGSDLEFALDVYGLKSGRNFSDPHHPDAPATNVLRLSERPTPETLARLDRVNAVLLKARNTRKQPRLDDKIIRSWNALMIGALAKAGQLMAHPCWIGMGSGAAEQGFLETFVSGGFYDRRVARTTAAGTVCTGGLLLEDVAAEVVAHAELERAHGEWAGKIADAITAVNVAYELFDAGDGGLLDAPVSSDLFVRPRSTYDGAIPSGSSIMLHGLIDVYELTGEDDYLHKALDLLTAISGAIQESPIATANATRALLRLLTVRPDALAAVQRESAPRPAADPSAIPGLAPPVIEVYASEERVHVGPDHPAELYVRIVIPAGWHINDAFAGEASGGTVLPMVLGIARGTGVQPYAEFPRGNKLGSAQHGVLSGEVEFAVALERAGEWSGTPRLLLTYQACSDRACLQPVTVELDVDIERLD
ncbi:MAG TPA: thioredoxin domain-containing protein [Phycisphaerales bacterium]|nr:thioredoxin domain-containing protein [Phycisphaerales bacterium]